MTSIELDSVTVERLGPGPNFETEITYTTEDPRVRAIELFETGEVLISLEHTALGYDRDQIIRRTP